MRERRTSLLLHPWLTVRVQLALGALFAAAAIPKLADPPSFAHMVYNYRLVPAPLLNAFALALPGIELAAAAALLLGVWRRAAAGLVGGLLVVFIVAIGVNLARGHAIACGCFDVHAAEMTTSEKLAGMRWDIVRDLGMLAMAVQLLASRDVRGD